MNYYYYYYITPIHKKSSTSDPGNYRPISLTSSCCRAMEQVINKDILNYLQANSLISPDHYGFLNMRSTCTNLIECTNDWSTAMQLHQGTDIIYFDFKKAFDSVSLQKLLKKLQAYGISDNLFDRLVLRNEKWQLQLAPEKCLQASIKTTGNSTTHNQYTISSRPISFTDNIRDLGVLIDSKLTFKAHINNIIHKAFIRLRLILKCFRSRDKRILTRAYCTYVRPILEYCSPVWSPQKQAAHNKDRTCPKVFHKGHSRIENSTLQEQT